MSWLIKLAAKIHVSYVAFLNSRKKSPENKNIIVKTDENGDVVLGKEFTLDKVKID